MAESVSDPPIPETYGYNNVKAWPVKTDSGRKGRAKSCTHCRQVKLKCDLQAKYPSACSRCASNSLNCRTDDTFRRVPARSRIKDLEAQIDQLRRAQTLEPPAPPRAEESNLWLSHRTAPAPPSHEASARGSSTRSSPGGSPTAQDSRWLAITDVPDPAAAFVLGDVTLTLSDVSSLFRTFDELFYPHFCCLEKVTSLRQLEKKSELLFWTIALTSARIHVRLSPLWTRLHAAHAPLYAKTCQDAVISPYDLQAILILCTWPSPQVSQSRDPSWDRLGLAINAAKQTGLNDSKDEAVFRRLRRSSSLPEPRLRKLTWLKCFELDVQLSTYHGFIPTLALPGHIRSIRAICSDPDVPREYAAMVEIHLQIAQFSVSLGDGLVEGISPNLVRNANRALDAVKSTYSSCWTVEGEIMLLSARLILFAICFVDFASPDPDQRKACSMPDLFAEEILQASRTSAMRMIELVMELSVERLNGCANSDHRTDTEPLPGYPKQYGKNMFLAAFVLLKYLDAHHADAGQEIDEARNSFGRVYHMYSSRPLAYEMVHVSRVLEVAGRAIGYGQWRLEPCVTTRMAASLRFDIVYMVKSIRDRLKETENSAERPGHEGEAPTSVKTAEPPSLPGLLRPDKAASGDPVATAPTSVDRAWMPPVQSQPDGFEFPFGIWDDAVYDSFLADMSPTGDVAMDWLVGMDPIIDFPHWQGGSMN